ncbi:MAG: glycine cleavage system protein GcvH [Pseudomonadota bacterium]
MAKQYSEGHEWIEVEDGIATIGVTDFAQQRMGDVVFVELPEPGAAIEQGEEVAVIESVKAASEVFAPLSGEILDVNTNLTDNPALINEAAEEDGWMVKIRLSQESQLEKLMTAEAYEQFCAQ